MAKHHLILPLAALCVASVVSAQTPASIPSTPTPSVPQPVTPTPTTPGAAAEPAPPVAPAGPISAVYIRARIDTLLQGITLNASQRRQIDSIFTDNSILLSTSAADSASDAAARERLLGMIGPIDAGVRRVLTTGQQLTFDSNMNNWRKKQRPSAS